MIALESSFQQDLNGSGAISSSAATIASQSATPLYDVAHFTNEQDPGWRFTFISQSDGAGISGPEGFFLGTATSQLLTELLREAQQNPTPATIDGMHEAFGSHDNVPTKNVFGNDLHTAYLIGH